MMRNTITAPRSLVGSTYLLSRATNVNSNTPSPPGTWLTRPATCASTNAQSTTPNVRLDGGSGSTAQSTAATSTQSTNAMAICASAIVPVGGANSHPRIRIGRWNQAQATK